MKVLLFESGNGEAFLILESVTSARSAVPSGRSWWQRTLRRVHDAYQRLQEKFDHGERACANLRHAHFLDIYHSPRLSRDRAEELLREFLVFSYRKHNRWAWVDFGLACLGLTLVWVPGPNVFSLYPAVRAMSHFFARNGARKAQSLTMEFHQEVLIEKVQQGVAELETVRPSVYALEKEYNVRGLEDQLRQMKMP